MNIEQAVRQALNTGAIAQTTIDSLYNHVLTRDDTRALAILQDAIDSQTVTVQESFSRRRM
ncbi:MAG: hypothetical protein WBA76_20640 [Phormidesmis sp.]